MTVISHNNDRELSTTDNTTETYCNTHLEYMLAKADHNDPDCDFCFPVDGECDE